MEVKIDNKWHKVDAIAVKAKDYGENVTVRFAPERITDIKLNGKQLFGNSEQVVVQKQSWKNEICFLLMLDGASAQLIVYPFPAGVQKITACISLLWTDEDKRRQGKARKLLETAERIAKQCGHKEVHICSSLNGLPIFIFQWLDRCGYKEVSDSDGLLIKKEL
jgi:GNAT superfamily N-acetyltransferase